MFLNINDNIFSVLNFINIVEDFEKTTNLILSKIQTTENVNNLMINNWNIQILLNELNLDTNLLLNVLQSSFFKINLESLTFLYTYYFVDTYYDFLLNYHYNCLINRLTKINYSFQSFQFFSLFKIFFKINFLFVLIYTVFFYSNLNNYIKQINVLNNLLKLFILNENEKELGSSDDFFFFAILFFSSILIFTIMSIFIIILQTNIVIWLIITLILISILILTIPLNLFLDFGINLFVYIRGSATSSNLLKELIFDLIATATIIIRFVVQNIRFVFIFGAIFELFEWVFSISSNLFFKSSYINNNLITNYYNNDTPFNVLLINTIMFIILYFYYSLHLIFLLFSQIIIYILISLWLFFFLYTSFFINKNEKFFIYKKFKLTIKWLI